MAGGSLNKGLGKNENGIIEPIQAQPRIGLSGLGYVFSDIKPQKHQQPKLEIDLDALKNLITISSKESKPFKEEDIKEWIKIGSVKSFFFF